MTQRNTVPKAVVIGQRIAQARLRLGMTQESLASEAEMPKSSLAQYETGRCLPSAERQSRLARALRMPQDRLFAGGLRCDHPDGPDPEASTWIIEASESQMCLLNRIQNLPRGFQDVALSMIEVAARRLIESEKAPVLLEG